jgi:hypothetical protein
LHAREKVLQESAAWELEFNRKCCGAPEKKNPRNIGNCDMQYKTFFDYVACKYEAVQVQGSMG